MACTVGREIAGPKSRPAKFLPRLRTGSMAMIHPAPKATPYEADAFAAARPADSLVTGQQRQETRGEPDLEAQSPRDGRVLRFYYRDHAGLVLNLRRAR